MPATNITNDLASAIESARAECDREWEASSIATIASTTTNEGPAAIARAAVHAEKANAAHMRAEALAAIRTTAPIYPEVDMAAHDVCCAAKHALIIGGSIVVLAPEGDGTNSLSTHKHGDIAKVLSAIPRGATVRISFQAAAPRSADLVLVALDAAGFKLAAVARHEDTTIGRPGKEKTMRDGMLAFVAPATIEAEIAAFARNVAHIAAGV